jgi:hypothetical protein
VEGECIIMQIIVPDDYLVEHASYQIRYLLLAGIVVFVAIVFIIIFG